MKNTGLLCLVSVCGIGLMASAVSAQTEWISDIQSDQCSPESRDKIAEAVRESIESKVARAEASIRAPASVADLACLDGLLNADVDIFSKGLSLEGFDPNTIINDLTSGLKSGLNVETLTNGVERAVCDFSDQKFNDLTSGLTGSLDDIVDRTSNLHSLTDGFGLMNIASLSGSLAETVLTSRAPVTGTTSGTFIPQINTVQDTLTGQTLSTEEILENIWDSLN